MWGAPASCSPIRNFLLSLFMSIINRIPSAREEVAWAPPGKSITGVFHMSSFASGSWLAANIASSRASWIAPHVASTMLLPVSVEPPTKIAEVPHSTATKARFAATSGDCLSGSMSVMCRVKPRFPGNIGPSCNHIVHHLMVFV